MKFADNRQKKDGVFKEEGRLCPSFVIRGVWYPQEGVPASVISRKERKW